MNSINILKQIGLSDNEAKVYLAVLELKKGLVTTIAEKAGVNRTTAYDVLKYLNQKGLVVQYIENNKAGFTTEGPAKIKNWLTQKENQIDQEKEIFKQNLDQLKHIFYSRPKTPRFKYFEGPNSMENFFNNSLDCLSGEIIGYASTTLVKDYATKQYVKSYVKQRYNKQIKGRYFVQEADAEQAKPYLQKYYQKYLQKNPFFVQFKILPIKEKKYFINETNIYDNKFAISHSGQDFFGVIIEDQEVANTQKIIFDVLWKKVKEEIKI